MKNLKILLKKLRNFTLGVLSVPFLSVSYSIRKGQIFAKQDLKLVKGVKTPKSNEKRLAKIKAEQKKLYEKEQLLKDIK